MPTAAINGAEIAYDDTGGTAPPLVLVHGSWADATNWAFVARGLSEAFRVITFDRRGHTRSTGTGTIQDDVEDIAGLLRHLGLAQAHVVGNSYGAIVSLRFAAAHPEMVLSLNVHEPPLAELLRRDPADAEEHWFFWALINRVRMDLQLGFHEDGARRFIQGFFPGAWEMFPEGPKAAFVANAPTFLDEILDEGGFAMAPEELAKIRARTLLTIGSETHSFFPPVLRQLAAALPTAGRFTFGGAGHVPQQSHPAEFVAKVREFALV